MNKIWLLVIVSITYGTFFLAMEDVEDADTQFNAHLARHVTKLRSQCGYDSSDLPASFDQQVHGPVLWLLKEPNSGQIQIGTLCGNGYVYDPEVSVWDRTDHKNYSHKKYINKLYSVYAQAREDGNERAAWKECEARINDWQIPAYWAYNKNAKLLLNVYQPSIDSGGHLQCVTLKTPHQTHLIDNAENYSIFTEGALSKDGTTCAYTWFTQRSRAGTYPTTLWKLKVSLADVTDLALLDAHPDKEKEIRSPHITYQETSTPPVISRYKVTPVTFALHEHEIKSESHLFFDDNNNVHLVEVAPDKIPTHAIITPPYHRMSHYCCMFDVGNNELLPMCFASRFPGLCATLKYADYNLCLSDKIRAIALFAYQHTHEVEQSDTAIFLPYDVIATILSIYCSVASDQVNMRHQSIYGLSFSDEQKKAIAVLASCIEYPHSFSGQSSSLVADVGAVFERDRRTDEDIWCAAKYGTLDWYEKRINGANKATQRCCDYLFNKYCGRVFKEYELKGLWRRPTLRVSISDQKIYLYEGKGEDQIPAVYPLRNSLLEHRDIVQTAENHKDFFAQCAVVNVERVQNPVGAVIEESIIVSFAGDQPLVAAKIDDRWCW